jgi:predicted homoserine dehydrogenase-like protein
MSKPIETVQPANLTDNWAHPSRGPRLPEIPVDAEGNPTEDAETVARKRAVKAKMLAEFAEQSAAADAMQAIVAAAGLTFSASTFTCKCGKRHDTGPKFTPALRDALHSDLRKACHGNIGNYQNTVEVLLGWGADIGPAR